MGSTRQFKNIIKFYVPAVILLICLLCVIFPYRVLLIKSGYPFAKIQKDKNIFQYIQTDSLRNRGVILSDGKPVGWIYQGLTVGDTCFIPFKEGHPPFDLSKDAAIDEDKQFQRCAWNLLFFTFCGIIALSCTVYFVIIGFLKKGKGK